MKKIQSLLLFGVFLLLLALCIRTETGVDFGLHVKAGEKILLEKHRIYQDPFTFTVPSHKYIDLSWLFQTVIYSIWHNFGMAGVALLRSLIILAAFGALFKACRIFSRNLSIILPLVLMVIFVCESRFYTRPELFTFLFLTAMLYILYQYQKGHKNLLWLLVVIQLLWANIHGFFILGWIVILCFLAGEFVEKKRIAKDILLCAVLAIAVSFLNPYTYEGVIQPFVSLGGLNESVYLKSITELLPPFSGPAGNWLSVTPIVLYACLIALSLAGIILNLKKQSAFNMLIYIFFLAGSLAAKRNVPLFCLAVLPMTVWNLDQIGSSLPRSKYLKIFELSALLGLLLFTAITICEVSSSYYYVKDRRAETFGIGISASSPVKAVEFVKDRKIKGNVFNHFDFGGYLLWRLYPEQKVFIDGRTEVMGDELYGYYLRSMDNELSWQDCVNRYRIDWVITGSREAGFLQMLYKSPDWKLVYFDETSAIFVKNTSENRDILKDEILLKETYQVPPELKTEAFQSFARYIRSTNPVKRFLSHLFSPQRFPAEYIHKGNVLASLGYPDQAEELYLKAILKDPQYCESLFNLGTIYYFKGRPREAMECYMDALEIDPHYEKAREWLAKCGPW